GCNLRNFSTCITGSSATNIGGGGGKGATKGTSTPGRTGAIGAEISTSSEEIIRSDSEREIWLHVVGVVFLLVRVSRGEMSFGVRIRGLVQAMQTQAHTQAALQAQLEAQAQVPVP
ncbi:hypothetical protein Taro_055329, partial [Colocasia esculenta]|nr:hypothetical protein [Colocasia esculenta]